MNYNPNIHHRKSYRLRGYDYRRKGLYFITICTKNRECFFGEIIDKEMNCTDLGKIAYQFFDEIPLHTKNAEVDVFCIMPNHVHGIIKLSGSSLHSDNIPSKSMDSNEISNYMQALAPKAGSISAIIRSYKSAVSRYSNQNLPDLNFEWHVRFWDHIIRNEEEYIKIYDYIINNPKNWDEDRFSKKE